MQYIITLNNIQESDLNDVGYRAFDLSVLKYKKLNVPLSFVVKNNAFNIFISENGLALKVEKILAEKSGKDAYAEIIGLFKKSSIPKAIENELVEAYESLSIDPTSPASSIINALNNPPVTIIRSPSFLLTTNDVEGIIQNVKGEESFLDSLKEVWASMYSDKLLDYKKRAGISGKYSLGVIVQKMKKINKSVVAYSKTDFDENKILMESFFGLHEFNYNETLGKDVHEIDINSLMVDRTEVNVQEYELLQGFESRELLKHELKGEGLGQKINDKQISEIARFVKRSKSFLGKHIKLYMAVRDMFTYVLLVNRMVSEPKIIKETKEEIKAVVDDSGESFIEKTEQVTVGHEDDEYAEEFQDVENVECVEDAEKVKVIRIEEELIKDSESQRIEMPRILTDEEAKKAILDEQPELLEYNIVFESASSDSSDKSDNSYKSDVYDSQKDTSQITDEMKKELDFLDEIEKEEENDKSMHHSSEFPDSTPSLMNEEIKNEKNLLEEVFKIKEIAEKMEEYAMNDNKEAYQQEARKLHEMINKTKKDA